MFSPCTQFIEIRVETKGTSSDDVENMSAYPKYQCPANRYVFKSRLNWSELTDGSRK